MVIDSMEPEFLNVFGGASPQEVSKLLERIGEMAGLIEENLSFIKYTIEKQKNEVIKAIIQEENKEVS